MAQVRPPLPAGSRFGLPVLDAGVDHAIEVVAPGVRQGDAAQPAGALAQVGGKAQVPVVAGGEVVAEVAHFPLRLAAGGAHPPLSEARRQEARLTVLPQGKDVERRHGDALTAYAQIDGAGDSHLAGQNLDPGTVEIEVGLGEVAGGVRPGVYVELRFAACVDAAAAVEALPEADAAVEDRSLPPFHVVQNPAAPDGVVPLCEGRHSGCIAVAESGRAGDDKFAVSIVDDLGGLQAGAALMDDGVAPQQQRVAAKGMDHGVGGVAEAVLPFRNGGDFLRRREHFLRGARVRRGGCAGIGVGTPGCRRRRQEREPGEMPPPGRPHRGLPPPER